MNVIQNLNFMKAITELVPKAYTAGTLDCSCNYNSWLCFSYCNWFSSCFR